ncbi:MAG: hypothetical protein AAGI23_06485 [Bacteroidota bacterium]
MKIPPFNLTKIYPNWISVYTAFTPSDSQGAVLDATPSTNRTAFDSSVNTTTSLISFDRSKINTFLEGESFRYEEDILPLTDQVRKGYPIMGATGLLVVCLLPPISGHSSGAEYESIPTENDYYFIATSADGLWHQVVIRGICTLLGLGDEFDLEGSEFLEPTTELEAQVAFYPNLQYFQVPPVVLDGRSKWYKLFSMTQRGMPIEVVTKQGDLTIPDRSLQTYPVSYAKPAFHEGGGGFRTKIYRSAKDSLLRRRIGDKTLPLREQSLALSPAAYYYIKNVIA